MPRPASVTDRHRNLLAPKVGQAVGRDELQADLGMRCFEAMQLWNEPEGGKRSRQRQRHAGAIERASDILGRLANTCKGRIDLREIAPSGRSERHRVAGSLEE